MPRIFISYRRADSQIISGRIYDQLEYEFGAQNIFKDVDKIPLGEDFRSVIRHEINKSDVMLVIIGPNWISVTDKQGHKRLNDDDDPVRIEVETGLATAGLRVIPVLVDNAQMPAETDLPGTLQPLIYLNAALLRNDPDFRRDMTRLVNDLKKQSTNTETANREIVNKRRWPRGILVLIATLMIVITVVVIFLNNNAARNQLAATFDPIGTANSRLTQTAVAMLAASATPTLDVEASVNAIMTNFVTQTVEAYTDTPQPTLTASHTATATTTPTRHLTATAAALQTQKALDTDQTAQFAALQATNDALVAANVPTITPVPTSTPTNTPTHTPTALPTATPTVPTTIPTVNVAASETAQAVRQATAQGNAQATQIAQANTKCTVQTDQPNLVMVRVGPGENRASITFLPANQAFQVIGKNIVENLTWWKLDKQEFNTALAANEVWVKQADVQASGNCDLVADVNAPPVVSLPGNSGSGASDICQPRTISISATGVDRSAFVKELSYTGKAGSKVNLRLRGTAVEISTFISLYFFIHDTNNWEANQLNSAAQSIFPDSKIFDLQFSQVLPQDATYVIRIVGTSYAQPLTYTLNISCG